MCARWMLEVMEAGSVWMGKPIQWRHTPVRERDTGRVFTAGAAPQSERER